MQFVTPPTLSNRGYYSGSNLLGIAFIPFQKPLGKAILQGGTELS